MTSTGTTESDLKLSKADGRLSIVLNRPQVANALTSAQCAQLVATLESATIDPEVRVVTIAATGRHFCAGMDLRRVKEDGDRPTAGPGGYPGRTMALMHTGSQRVIGAVLDCMKPVVSIVQGPAAGLGLYLAFASDLVVASTDAVFVEAFLARGMALHCGGAHVLVARLGMQRAKELVLLGGRLEADEAHRLGLVNRVAAPDELTATADELVARLAAAPTIAVGLSKRLLNRAVGAERASAFAEEAMAMELNSVTLDAIEGSVAFGERRAPDFVGW